MKFEVICIGALNVDILYKVDQFAASEEEIEILSHTRSPGGSAANTVAGLSRLGVKTGYIGKVAKGKDGEFLVKNLENEGVNTDGIIVSETGRCGIVVGFVNKNGERALYLDPGINNNLKFEEINLKYIKTSSLLHLSSFAGDLPFEAQKKIISCKQISDIKITLDPGIIYARKGIEHLKPIINRCFAVLPNEKELRLITGKNLENGAKQLLLEGVKIVAVKRGKRGCYVTNGTESHYVKGYKVKVVDTTGAGDAFCAGFIYGLLRSLSLRECSILGNFVASWAITKMGARNGLPYKPDLPILN